MSINYKKGYVLIMAIICVIVLMTASVGFFASIRHLFSETEVGEFEYTRGFYADIAAMRFIEVELQNDAEAVFGLGRDLITGDEVLISLWSDYNNFAEDLGLDASRDVVVTITYLGEEEGFDISAAYSYTS